MNYTILQTAVFLGLTFLFLLIFIFKSENLLLNIIYFACVIISQVLFVYYSTSSLCGSPQTSAIFIWGIIPWVFIFITMTVVIKTFPGWKAPFSNTIGYLVTMLLGVNNTFTSLLKPQKKSKDPGLNKILEEIYEDKSILINEFTPTNFDVAIKKLQPLFDTSNPNFQSNLNYLKQIVRIKDEISRAIWYILTGLLTISVSNMGVASTKCKKTPEQIKKELEEYHQNEAKRHKQSKQDKPSKYYIRD